MARTKTTLTKAQIAEAVKILGEWFPEEAENLKKYHDDIVHHIFEGTEPNEGELLFRQKHTVEKSDVDSAVEFSLTPCKEAIAVAGADAVIFIFGLLKLSIPNEQRITSAVLHELREDSLNRLLRAIHAFNDAKGAIAKVGALFAIVSQIYNVGGFRAVFKELKDDMSWWDWIKTGVIAVAQIIAWVATDGAAFGAEIALNIMSATQLIEDSAKAVKTCESS